LQDLADAFLTQKLDQRFVFGSERYALNNWKPPSLVLPSLMSRLASVKNPLDNCLCRLTRFSILGFNASNSWISPLGTYRNDQRCSCIIDQNRIDLVDNREIVFALYEIFGRMCHVVAQVIETEFVVGSVGDVGVIGFPSFLCWVGSCRYILQGLEFK
jgi:hypothetical protein